MWINIGPYHIKTDNIVMVEKVDAIEGGGVRLWHSFSPAGALHDYYLLDEETGRKFLQLLDSENFSQWDFVLTDETPDIDDPIRPPS